MENLQHVRIDPSKLRAARGHLRPTDIARQIRISRTAIYKYEAGTCAPNAHRLAQLCELYGCQIGDLISTG